METTLYNRMGKQAGTITLSDAVFGVKWNADLVHQVAESERTNRRQPVAHVKTRGEVSGGGKKPWRQKGTGRARHGSTRSPIWRHGGVTHGPNSQTAYAKKLNKKMIKKALATVLSAKLRDHEILFVDDVFVGDHKTASVVSFLKALRTLDGFSKLGISGGKTLILTSRHDTNTVRAVRNIRTIGIKPATMAQVHEVLGYKYVIIAKPAVDTLEQAMKKA